MTIFFVIFTILWIINLIGFVFNGLSLLSAYNKERLSSFDMFRITVLEIRCSHNLIIMWIGVIGILILNVIK